MKRYRERGDKSMEILNHVIAFFQGMGYTGIIIMMLLEASFIPFPSELAMIPAGFLIAQGKMSFSLAIGAGILGSVLGSSLNYFLGRRFGRNFLERYGRYLFLSPKDLDRMDILFEKKGKTIVFWGRLIPVVRQYISFPPGVSKMSYGIFALFTALGSGLWVSFLVWLGYFYGNNMQAINGVISKFKLLSLTLLGIGIIYYGYKIWQKKNRIAQ